MMRSMFDLLKEGVFYNRSIMFKQRMTRSNLLDQHRAINVAIQGRAPDRARAAVGAHMDYVKAALSDQQKSDQNERYAKKRFEHEQGR
jgi:GntR family transcriptional repressor for pyruvate dehydrogenase complex